MVKTGSTSLGTVLTDSGGMTLYVFTADSANSSTCTGVCASNWPPVTAGGPVTAGDGVTGTLGTIKRSDGTMQATYNGMPLYRYASDSAPGDVKGQGVGGKWYAATPGMTTFPSAGGVSG
jgi:predicted lipoprotein with Yx(FWY)xxD motif